MSKGSKGTKEAKVAKDLKESKLGLTGPEAYKKCERILQLLKKHRCAENFMFPPEGRAQTPEPLDLGVIEKRLKAHSYPSTTDLALDVRKIWNSSWLHSPPGTPLYMSTTEISDYFEKLWMEVGDVAFGGAESVNSPEPKKQSTKGSNKSPKTNRRVPAGKTTKSPGDKSQSQDKAQLKERIMELEPSKLAGLLHILKDVVNTKQNQETLEFDLDSLPARTFHQLELYVQQNTPPMSSGVANNSPPLACESVSRYYNCSPHLPSPRALHPKLLLNLPWWGKLPQSHLNPNPTPNPNPSPNPNLYPYPHPHPHPGPHLRHYQHLYQHPHQFAIKLSHQHQYQYQCPYQHQQHQRRKRLWLKEGRRGRVRSA